MMLGRIKGLVCIAAMTVMSGIAGVKASVDVVAADGSVMPIQLLANSHELTKSSDNSYDIDTSNLDGKSQLLRKYGGLENAIFNIQHLSEDEIYVLRELVIDQQIAENKAIEEQKLRGKVNAIEQANEVDIAIRAAQNSPQHIRKLRVVNENIEKAIHAPLHLTTTTVETIDFDPASNELIQINTTTSRPTMIEFYDSMGTPYEIIEIFPKTEATFQFKFINKTSLAVHAKKNHRTLNGFIFLKGIQDSIAVVYTANPEKPLDVKKKYVLPQISTESEALVEELTIDRGLLTTGDPALQRFGHLRYVPNSKPVTIIGTDGFTRAWRYNGFVYMRTKHQLKYEIAAAARVGKWFIWKAYPRDSYWMVVNNQEIEVFVDENIGSRGADNG